jgi:hypothetical protein
MASATGIPSNAAAARGQSEEEPLLGRRGDASQSEGQPLYWNLWIGMFCVIWKRWWGESANVRMFRHGTNCAGGHMDSRSDCMGRDLIEEVDFLLCASCE